MRNVVFEYAGSVIAVLGTVSFFAIMGQLFLGQNGLIAVLITTVLGGM